MPAPIVAAKGLAEDLSRFGKVAFDGEWDPKEIFAVLSKGNEAYWRGKRVLDIGSNTSGLRIEIARRGVEVVAIEPDPYSNTFALARSVLKNIIESEGLRVDFHRVELLKAHEFGAFDAVLCLGLIYHFRYFQYTLDYLSTLETTHLFISTQTYPGDALVLVNRRDTSILRPDFLGDDVVLTGWHPTRSLFECMLRWAGFDEVISLTDRSVDFPKKALPGLTNSAYYRATKVASTDPEKARSQYYPR